jgi:glycine betaine/proline transport system ATP-binding protein
MKRPILETDSGGERKLSPCGPRCCRPGLSVIRLLLFPQRASTSGSVAMTAARAAIELKNVWKVFGARAREAMAAIKEEGLGKDQVLERFGCVVAVADASFTVAAGETFCVMGLSGSGKSTLVRHINRLIEPTAGQIFVDGEEIGALNQAALRAIRGSRIAMVFQNMALMPHRTVRDNVALGLEIRKLPRIKCWEIAERMIDLVKLSGWEDRYPWELSGGMQQRVGLARALATDPTLLLMDEPFSALDPLIRRQLQDFFLDLATRLSKTTIFVTHDLDEAIRVGTRIAIMKDGRIVQIGTPEQVIMRPADDYVADFVRGISRLKLWHSDPHVDPALDPRLEAASPT